MYLDVRLEVVCGLFAAWLCVKVLCTPAEIPLPRLREFEALVLLEDPGDAALAGLAVDAERCRIGSADIRRIDGQIRHVPDFVIAGFLCRKPLLDCVLVGARKGCEHQFACLRVAGANREQLGREPRWARGCPYV